MSKVLVIDTDKKPQNPIHPAQARQLLRNKFAAVFRRFPFTIILFESRPSAPNGNASRSNWGDTPVASTLVTGATHWLPKTHKGFSSRQLRETRTQRCFTALDSPVEPLRIKIDPGSKTTGIALVNDATGEVVWAAELQHRGFAIRESLLSRRQLRRSRRNRKTMLAHMLEELQPEQREALLSITDQESLMFLIKIAKSYIKKMGTAIQMVLNQLSSCRGGRFLSTNAIPPTLIWNTKYSVGSLAF